MSTTPHTDAVYEKLDSRPGFAICQLRTHSNKLETDLQATQAALKQAVEALEWAMSKEPSPCRCMDFATPPHVCTGHRAITAAQPHLPQREGKPE